MPTTPTQFYNLDAIISVGYRVNSSRATQFRIWSTTVLREYLTKGYAINEKKVKQQQESIEALKTSVDFLARSLTNQIKNLLYRVAKPIMIVQLYLP